MPGRDHDVTRLASLLRVQQIESPPEGPRVFIAGHQLTGKSTAATRLAQRLGVPVVSGGSVVRSMARESGRSVEAMSVSLRGRRDADLDIDGALARSAVEGPVVIESRLAGWLGAVVEQVTGIRTTKVLLRCSAAERAIRWAQRELHLVPAQLRNELGRSDGRLDLLGEMQRMVALLPDHQRPGTTRLREAASRDQADRDRLRTVYGVDYDDDRIFDSVLDVSAMSPEAVADALQRASRVPER